MEGKSSATFLYYNRYMLFYYDIFPLIKHADYLLCGTDLDYICAKEIVEPYAPTKISVRTETLSCIS